MVYGPWPNICQRVHIRIWVYVFIRAPLQVISERGIYLICWTKINVAGQPIVPQLGFNQPRWNRTDLWRNQNSNRNGTCQVWILGSAFRERVNHIQMSGQIPLKCVLFSFVLVCKYVRLHCSQDLTQFSLNKKAGVYIHSKETFE